jgi:hypothetical protein
MSIGQHEKVPAALEMQRLVDVGRMGCSSLAAHSADIHHSLPQWTSHFCMSPRIWNHKLTLSLLNIWNLLGWCLKSPVAWRGLTQNVKSHLYLSVPIVLTTTNGWHRSPLAPIDFILNIVIAEDATLYFHILLNKFHLFKCSLLSSAKLCFEHWAYAWSPTVG